MNRRLIIIGILIFLIVFVIFSGIIYIAGNANAGISLNGFAFYAKQGITNEINLVYGKRNSPYVVSCKDNPNFQNISDKVICTIRKK